MISEHQKRQESERRLKLLFLGDRNMHLRRSKTRIFEGGATKVGGGDCAFEHM